MGLIEFFFEYKKGPFLPKGDAHIPNPAWWSKKAERVHLMQILRGEIDFLKALCNCELIPIEDKVNEDSVCLFCARRSELDREFERHK